jgi:hypothetical protein
MSTDDSLGRPADQPRFEPIQPELDYPDPRTEQQRSDEAVGAVMQSGALDDQVTSHEQVDDLVRSLQARQLEPRGLGRIARFPGRPDGQPVLHMHGEIVIRTDQPRALRSARAAAVVLEPEELLARLRQLDHRFAPVEDPTAVPGVRRFSADVDPVQLWQHVLQLREELQLPAGLNLVVPLGHIIKGINSPTATVARHRYSPRFDGARVVPVAVIDTGITPENRTDGWLSGVARAGVEDLLNVFPASDRLDVGAGHGTFTAGVIQQVAPAADIRMYRAPNSDGVCTEAQLADALLRAAADGAMVINVSMGTPTPDNLPPTAMESAIEQISLEHPETLIVASAGNDGLETPMWPAAFKAVVAVGALGDDMTPAAWSTHGFWVDCSVVGVGVASPFVPGLEPPEPGMVVNGVPVPDVEFIEDAWALWSGTSFAAPQIAGAVARLCQQDPNLRPKAALQQLLAGQPFKPGYGRLVRLLPGTPTP